MHYSELTDRIAGESVDTWNVHYRAMSRLEAGEDIYLMSIGQESDSISPQGVMDAACQSIEIGRHHYTAVEGDTRLREIIAKRHSKMSGAHVDRDSVVVFCGAQNALFATAQVLLQAGDEVILIEPYYTTYPATVTASGATLVSVALLPEEEFQLNADRVIDAITPRTRAILINSPNNPTGAIYSRAPLQALVDACREQDIWLISDEVYMDIVEDPAPCRPYGLDGARDVVISVSSVSKSYRMTGWRVGWAIGPRDLAQHYYNLNMCMNYGLPAVSQDAALHALKHECEVIDTIKQRLAKQRRVVIDGLNSTPGVEVYSPGGGMFVILDIRKLGIDSMEFAAGLLDQEDVSLQSLTGFGPSCRGLLRISAVLKEERLHEACRRINRYVKTLM